MQKKEFVVKIATHLVTNAKKRKEVSKSHQLQHLHCFYENFQFTNVWRAFPQNPLKKMSNCTDKIPPLAKNTGSVERFQMYFDFGKVSWGLLPKFTHFLTLFRLSK